MRQFLFIDRGESQFFEESFLVGEHKYPLGAKIISFTETMFNKAGPNAISKPFLVDRKRTDFCKSIPADVERTDACNAAIVFKDRKVTKVLVQFIERSWQHLALVGILVDDELDGFYIGDPCFSNHAEEYLVGAAMSIANLPKTIH
jgi:hypothetical protein